MFGQSRHEVVWERSRQDRFFDIFAVGFKASLERFYLFKDRTSAEQGVSENRRTIRNRDVLAQNREGAASKEPGMSSRADV